jgi:hypothetical protein
VWDAPAVLGEAFIGAGVEGRGRGRQSAEQKSAAVCYKRRLVTEEEATGRGAIMGREEDEAAWLGWTTRAEEGGVVAAAAWPSTGGGRRLGMG